MKKYPFENVYIFYKSCIPNLTNRIIELIKSNKQKWFHSIHVANVNIVSKIYKYYLNISYQFLDWYLIRIKVSRSALRTKVIGNASQ